MKRGILYLLLLIWTAGCSDHTDDEKPVVTEDKVQLVLVPEKSRLATRAADHEIEERIDNLTVLAFEEMEENVFSYTYQAIAEKVNAESNKYNVTLRLSDVAVKLLLIANHTDFEVIRFGCPLEEATTSLLSSFTSQGITAIPMYGEISFSEGLTYEEAKEDKNIPLLRSVAAVEVRLGSGLPDSRFLLKSVEAYRANNLIQLIPNSSVLVQDGQTSKVKDPSVPGDAQHIITTQRISAGDEPVRNLDRFYLPESEKQETGDIITEATCLIIGGIYRKDDPTNEKVTYYRVDFKDADKNITGQILRNYFYSIEITDVNGPGTTHPEEADTVEIETVFTDWSDPDLDDINL